MAKKRRNRNRKRKPNPNAIKVKLYKSDYYYLLGMLMMHRRKRVCFHDLAEEIGTTYGYMMNLVFRGYGAGPKTLRGILEMTKRCGYTMDLSDFREDRTFPEDSDP